MWVESYPEDVKMILAEGHDLGNHSQNHKNMSQLSDSEKEKELMTVHDKVKELTGYDMFLFRPPYGDYDSKLIKVVRKCNYYPIQWDVDSLDWKGLSAQDITSRVCSRVKNGSIILMHNNSDNILDALRLTLNRLKVAGYKITCISDLVYENDYNIDRNGVQHKN